MGDLVEFLRARLDEAEARARGDEHSAWHEGDCGYGLYVAECYCDVPAQVLADVGAKRRIIAEHFPIDPCDAHDASFKTIACDTLRLLALPYADHHDYREEWRP